jgi:anaerobic selenocysteine-containing dehydrogenase
MTEKLSCKFCAGRCGMLIRVEEKRIAKIKGDPDHPVSRGWTCARGRAATAKAYKELLS